MTKLNSKKHPNISYTAGEDIWLDGDETGLTFKLTVDSDVTNNIDAMNIIADFLDDIDTLKSKAVEYLKSVLANKEHDDYQLVHSFLECHEDEMGTETYIEMLGVDEENKPSLEEAIDYLNIRRLGSNIDKKSGKQELVMDLCFNPEFTDQLMVIYFDTNKEIILVSHES